jgi:hypothetical protein
MSHHDSRFQNALRMLSMLLTSLTACLTALTGAALAGHSIGWW